MLKWDLNALDQRFRYKAEGEEIYLREIASKIPAQPADQHVHDEHLAHYYVANRLHGKTFLRSRTELLDALSAILGETPQLAARAYGQIRFHKYYANI